MEKINKISYKFFGRELDDSFGDVIITNIRSVYTNIVKNAEIINQSQGFYECSFIHFRSKKYLVIKISPGNVIIDVLKGVSRAANNILLIGLAGSLNSKYPIGSIVCPRAVVDLENLDKKINFNNVNGDGLIYQADGLIKDDSFYLDLMNSGVDFVDMESFYLASFCEKNNIKAGVISIVSDEPLKEAFYENNILIERYFEKALDTLINSYL